MSKFAIVEGVRREAEPELRGQCTVCDSIMVSRCGERRIRHWAHLGVRHCDVWWEPETDWHRAWKNLFPKDWQEIIQRDTSGEKHIADVKTERNRVIEFQHSYLDPKERRAREAFYKAIFWVVDGSRRKRDKPSLYKQLNFSQPVSLSPVRLLIPVARCPLLLEWAESRVPVFFDFGAADSDKFLRQRVIWNLGRINSEGLALLTPIPVSNFVGGLLNGTSIKGIHLLPSTPPEKRRPLQPSTPWSRGTGPRLS